LYQKLSRTANPNYVKSIGYKNLVTDLLEILIQWGLFWRLDYQYFKVVI